MTAFVISNAGGNWNAAASYVANSGFPVAGDTVTATPTSGNLTVNVASACASIILTNYVGTLTFDSTLTLTSTCTLVSGMTVAGTAGTLIGTGTATYTSAGKTLTCKMTLQGTATYTMADDWTVNGLVTLGSGTLTTTINAQTIHCVGGLHGAGTTSTIAGTTTFSVEGGTWDTAQTSGTNGFQVNVTIAGSITISGDIRFGGSKTLTYSSGTLTGASTPRLLFSGGSGFAYTITGFSGTTGATGQWPGGLVFSVAGTATLGSDLSMSGLLQGNTQPLKFAGAFNVACGTLDLTGSAGVTHTLTGTLTCAGAATNSNTGTQTWSGNFAVNLGSYTITGGSTTSPASGQSWVMGTLTISGSSAVWNSNGASSLNISGLTTTTSLTGTQTVTFGSTGTWTGAAGTLSNSATINTSGTLTLSGTILYAASGTPTLTYTAGTVSAGASTLSIASSCTLATNGMSWTNVTLTAALTLTLSSLLTATGTFTFPNAAVTLAGAGNASIGVVTSATISAARIYTMDSGNTYTITTAFSVIGLTGGHVTFAGSAASGTKANIVLNPTATQSLVYVDATDIDSSGGQTIHSPSGTLLRTVNWSTTASGTRGLAAVGYAS